ncbi:hypothetical protein ACQKPX_12645 [Photobacterium sp. DNB23_23_1]|uniref:DUF2541 domain-containing protein n=1 Tax=Photobacterium pectinilyticum TaxID=2906793 RepID=A0ABT1N342_9GAMM|nr:hypothetical protein [Photobacterium sp. ZSDE20]MCQ1059165.1 hypothetical protein [Photobacterium sp. ZSDE20]MDD1824817.1 hypothetical protein [Photobacterium sp. ZSDE20]
MKNGIQDALTVVGIVSLIAFSGSSIAKDEDRKRIECEKRGAYDTSMDARFEARDDRKKFDVSFEAAPGGKFYYGQVLNVYVDYERVGSMTLRYEGYDLEGDLEFDSHVDSQYDDSVPFPKNFPSVGYGTHVTIGSYEDGYLSCTL